MFTFVETHTTCFFFRQSFVYQITFEMATNSRFESVSTDEVNAFLSLERNKNTVNKTNSDMTFMNLYLKSKDETREINHIPPRDNLKITTHVWIRNSLTTHVNETCFFSRVARLRKWHVNRLVIERWKSSVFLNKTSVFFKWTITQILKLVLKLCDILHLVSNEKCLAIARHF